MPCRVKRTLVIRTKIEGKVIGETINLPGEFEFDRATYRVVLFVVFF